jgi:hypothetical protein
LIVVGDSLFAPQKEIATPRSIGGGVNLRRKLEPSRYFFLVGAFAGGADGAVKVHGGTVSAVGANCSGVKLFLLSTALKATRSCDNIVFHAATVAL